MSGLGDQRHLLRVQAQCFLESWPRRGLDPAKQELEISEASTAELGDVVTSDHAGDIAASVKR